MCVLQSILTKDLSPIPSAVSAPYALCRSVEGLAPPRTPGVAIAYHLAVALLDGTSSESRVLSCPGCRRLNSYRRQLMRSLLALVSGECSERSVGAAGTKISALFPILALLRPQHCFICCLDDQCSGEKGSCSVIIRNIEDRNTVTNSLFDGALVVEMC